MKLTALKPLLWTVDLQESIDFYTEILGFTCGERNDDWVWATLHKDDVEIMFAKPNEQTPFDNPTFTGSLYFNTDDVDALWEDLKDKAAVCYPIENFDWEMREFAIFDNNGYILQFGQPVSELKESAS